MLETIKRPYVTGAANETVDFLNDVQIQYGVYSEGVRAYAQGNAQPPAFERQSRR